MYAHTGNFQVPSTRGLRVQGAGLADRNTEFVLVEAGRDVRMRIRWHVRIHAEGNPSGLTHTCRAFRQRPEFRLAFHVEQEDAGAQPGFHFVAGLADSRKDNLPGSASIDGQYPCEFSAGDHVKAAVHPEKKAQYGKIRIRLDRVADRVARILEGAPKGEHASADGRCGVDVERRAETFGQLMDWRCVAAKHTACRTAQHALAQVTIRKRRRASIGERDVAAHLRFEALPLTLMATTV